MKKLLYLFVCLLPVVAFAQSEKEAAGKMTHAASQQQLAKKATVKVQVDITKRGKIMFSEYNEMTTTMECVGVIENVEVEKDRVLIVVPDSCLDGIDVGAQTDLLCRVHFLNEENPPTRYRSFEGMIPDLYISDHLQRYYPSNHGYYTLLLETGDSYVEVPLSDLSSQVRNEIEGLSLTHTQIKNILKNAPAPKKVGIAYKKVS